MNRRDTVLALLALGAAGAPFTCLGQQRKDTWRVGFFISGPKGLQSSEKAFLAEMKVRGYELGRNLLVEFRYGNANSATYAAIADELIALKPDVIVVSSSGNAAVLAAKTKTIPIVLGTVADPVGEGLVRSLARPGGNVTGNSLQLVELGAKQIEFVREVLPRTDRVAVLTHLAQTKAVRARYEEFARKAAAVRKIALDMHPVDTRDSVRQALQTAQSQGTDAVLVTPAPQLNALRKDICQLSIDARLALVGFSEEWARDGALMGFGPSWAAANRRVAYFVDRILKGAKPTDLPIEQPTKFDLAVNARTARALGIAIPGSILLRAERVIE